MDVKLKSLMAIGRNDPNFFIEKENFLKKLKKTRSSSDTGLKCVWDFTLDIDTNKCLARAIRVVPEIAGVCA